jgi:small-conductance mechanosensitive channel
MPTSPRDKRLSRLFSTQSQKGTYAARSAVKPLATTSTRKRKRRLRRGSAVKGAEKRLKNFRQASILAVAITGFFLLLISPSEAGLGFEDEETQAVDSLAAAAPRALSSKEATDEAIGALQNLWDSFYYNLPKLLIALVALLLTWLLTRLVRALVRRFIGHWHSGGAISTLISLAIWLLGIGIVVSIVAGDIRALVGSFGLIGLALSWSLQTPIESFTGWLLNSFQGYYRVGDRVKVGEVFGDVYRIDFLTTTVWEIGAPYQPGFVQAEQPTGRMVTFPNNEILSGTVINLTGDFPYVWDELTVSIANESDLKKALEVLERIAQELLAHYMVEPARAYAQMLQSIGIPDPVSEKPQVFVSSDDSWTNITIRYLVGARERRKWKSELTIRTTLELNKPEYVGIIIPVYPRQQVQFINPDGVPVESGAMPPPPTP